MPGRLSRFRSRLAAVMVSMSVAGAMAALALAMPAGPSNADTNFPQTGTTLWGPFEEYWKAHGGLAQFGMPRTGVFPSKAGRYDAQWLERAMFTYNPRNPDPHKVQLQLLGSIVTESRRSEAPFRRAGRSGRGQYFEATGHNLEGKFLQYWQSKGGLPIYGYPISEAFTERSKSDGKQYLVQYFERNRFELHPERAGTPYEVQLGLLGSELLDAQGGPAAFAKPGAPNYYPPSAAALGAQAPGTYPKYGQAKDYSWIAGQVVFTQIQGGCVFIRAVDTSDQPTPTPLPPGSPGSPGGPPIVGTAVQGDTSPPLRDITPGPTPRPDEGGPWDVFSPNGDGWDLSRVKDGDHVVVWGHLAAAGEPQEMCPGGKPYIVDKMILNP